MPSELKIDFEQHARNLGFERKKVTDYIWIAAGESTSSVSIGKPKWEDVGCIGVDKKKLLEPVQSMSKQEILNKFGTSYLKKSWSKPKLLEAVADNIVKRNDLFNQIVPKEYRTDLVFSPYPFNHEEFYLKQKIGNIGGFAIPKRVQTDEQICFTK